MLLPTQASIDTLTLTYQPFSKKVVTFSCCPGNKYYSCNDARVIRGIPSDHMTVQLESQQAV